MDELRMLVVENRRLWSKIAERDRKLDALRSVLVDLLQNDFEPKQVD